MTIEEVREEFKLQLEENPQSDMLEILGANFIADEETIFGSPNRDYIDEEINWYESQSLYVYDLPNPPRIWKEVACKDGYINSNYGWCIYSPYNYQQYNKVKQELIRNPDTRRAIMIYNRPSMHEDAVKNGMNDFMCTNAVTYFIRDSKLHCVVQMRSNDAWAGYRNDYAWQYHVLKKLANDIGLEVGDIHWQVASLHVYPRQYYLVHHYIETGETHISKGDHRELYKGSKYG